MRKIGIPTKMVMVKYKIEHTQKYLKGSENLKKRYKIEISRNYH